MWMLLLLSLPVSFGQEAAPAAPPADPTVEIPLDLGALGASGSGGFSIRDPFQAPDFKLEENDGPRTPLELVAADKFKLVGVITGPDRFRAMVQDPSGQTHLVSEKMKIGIRKGVVKKITSRGIWVREKVVNVLGQEESVDTVLKLEDPAKKVANSGGGLE